MICFLNKAQSRTWNILRRVIKKTGLAGYLGTTYTIEILKDTY